MGLMEFVSGEELKDLSPYDQHWAYSVRTAKAGVVCLGATLFLACSVLVAIAAASEGGFWLFAILTIIATFATLICFIVSEAERDDAENIRKQEKEAIEQLAFEEAEHKRQLELMDAGRAQHSHEELAHEAAMEAQRELYRENQRALSRWKLVVGMAGDAMQALILVEEQLKDNPLYEDLVRKYTGLYRLINDIDPQVNMDESVFKSNLENVLLAKYAKEEGLDPDAVFGGKRS